MRSELSRLRVKEAKAHAEKDESIDASQLI